MAQSRTSSAHHSSFHSMHIFNRRRPAVRRNGRLHSTQQQQQQVTHNQQVIMMGNNIPQQRRPDLAATTSSSSRPSPLSQTPPPPEQTAWRTAVDPNTQKLYYWNIHTRESRWKKPIELASPSERAEMERKEREQKSFFEEMERNILKRLKDGGCVVGAAAAPVVAAPVSTPSMESPKEEMPFDEMCLTPTEEANPLSIQESWVQSWIDNSSPLTLDTASVSSASPLSCHGSIVSYEDERDDKVYPLKKDVSKTKAKLGRIQKKAIDKPNLVRTISKMEYDLTALLRGMESSPNGVEDVNNSSLLAGLCITHEAEGVGCDLHPLHAPNMSPGSISDDDTLASADVVKPHLVKRNTCGTIYLGSTLSSPDKDALIKCVCGVFRAHLLQSDNVEPRPEDWIFDDDSSSRTLNHSKITIPSLEDITSFYRDVFLRSQMETDCIVISLIYVERLIKLSSGKLRPTPSNWKSLLFSCMVLASKVWDDLSMWNADFSKIGPGGYTFSLRRTNELEVALLTALDFKVKVGASEYAKYYFLLRSMLCRSGLADDSITMLDPLNAEGVQRTGAQFCDLGVKPIMKKSRSKSLGDWETKEEKEAGFDAMIGGSPKPLSKKVSLEQLMRM